MQKVTQIPTRKILITLLMVLAFGTVTAQCPTVASVSPDSGPAGTVVTITGTNFEAGTGASAIQFNGVTATGFTIVSNTVIEAIVPDTGTTGNITITANGCDATSSIFTVLATNCPAGPVTTDLYISELYDHVPGSYGVIELYNPTNSTIVFGGQYVLERYGDVGAGSPSYTLILPGSIGPESTYLVLSYGSGVAGCSVVTQASMGTGINDNDQFKLWKNGTQIDEARAPGNTGYTVIRNPDAVAPTPTYNAGDWNINGTQSCADLGNHNTNIVAPVVEITNQPDSVTLCEGGQAVFTVAASNTEGFAYQWKTLNASGTWVNVTNGSGFSGANTASLTINPVPFSLNGTQYYCQISSGASCTLVSDAAQLTVSPLPVATVDITQPSCTSALGTITISPSLGEGLTYSLNGIIFQPDTTFSNVPVGTYTLTIKSSSNCITTQSVTINPAPAAPPVATTTVTQPTCTTATGTITITAPTGTGLSYSIDGGASYQPQPEFSGLTPGVYLIMVQNADGCTSVTTDIMVNPAPGAPAVATTTVTQPTCTTATGAITITAPTGAGLTYSIDGTNFQAGTEFSGLAPGIYTVTVQNADGCTSITPDITINAAPDSPAVATTTVTQPTCATPTGTITITAPVGTGLTYSIDGGASYQPQPEFSGLTPGVYLIMVQNTEGCTSVTTDIMVNPAPDAPAVATTTVTQLTCTTATGAITITAPTGAGLTYSIDGGASYQPQPEFSGLAPGVYLIMVQNADGCTSVTTDIMVNPAPGAPAVATTTVTQPTCATPTGIITITTPTGAEYLYSIDGGASYQPQPEFSGLTPGTYTVTVQNADGCTSVTPDITINAAPDSPAVATTTVIQPTCAMPTGTITITAPVGAGLTYSIDGGASYQPQPEFSGLAPGIYTITVQNADGCTSTGAGVVINEPGTGPEVTGTQGCNGSSYILEALPLNDSFDPATAVFEWRNEEGNSAGNDSDSFNVTEYIESNNISNAAFPLVFELTVITPDGCEGTYTFTVTNASCEEGIIPKGISPNADDRNDNFDITWMSAKNLVVYNRHGKEVYQRSNYKNEWYGQASNGDELPSGTYFYVIETTEKQRSGWVYINREM